MENTNVNILMLLNNISNIQRRRDNIEALLYEKPPEKIANKDTNKNFLPLYNSIQYALLLICVLNEYPEINQQKYFSQLLRILQTNSPIIRGGHNIDNEQKYNDLMNSINRNVDDIFNDGLDDSDTQFINENIIMGKIKKNEFVEAVKKLDNVKTKKDYVKQVEKIMEKIIDDKTLNEYTKSIIKTEFNDNDVKLIDSIISKTSPTIVKQQMGNKYNLYIKTKFNNMIGIYTEIPIKKLNGMRDLPMLKSIYQEKIIDTETWKRTFSSDILSKIDKSLSDVSNVNSILSFKDTYFNKLSIDKTPDQIGDYISKNIDKKKFDLNDTDFIQVINSLIIPRVESTAFDTFFYMMEIYKNLFYLITEDNEINKRMEEFVENKLMNVKERQSLNDIYLKMYLLRVMINSDNKKLIVIESILAQITKECTLIKGNIDAYIYLLIAISEYYSIYVDFINYKYKDKEVTIPLPKYNNNINSVFIVQNKNYGESVLYEYIDKFFAGILSNNKLSIQTNEYIMTYNNIIEFNKKTLKDIYAENEAKLKGKPEKARQARQTEMKIKIKSPKGQELMEIFNKNKYNPKYGETYLTISGYAEKYIEELNKIKPNVSDNEFERIKRFIVEYEKNYKYIAYIKNNGEGYGCNAGFPEEKQRRFETHRECISSINKEFIFYFEYADINDQMKNFWNGRKKPMINGKNVTILEYADHYNNLIGENDKKATSLINYYKKNYKYTKPKESCVINDPPYREMKTYNTFDECKLDKPEKIEKPENSHTEVIKNIMSDFEKDKLNKIARDNKFSITKYSDQYKDKLGKIANVNTDLKEYKDALQNIADYRKQYGFVSREIANGKKQCVIAKLKENEKGYDTFGQCKSGEKN